MAGRLGQTDAARNDGPEDLIFEELAQIGRNLPGEVGAIVVHGEQNPFNLKRMAEGIADAIDGIHQARNTFEGEEFTLDRDENGVGCHERVECEEVERGRAVDEDVLIIVADAVEMVAQNGFAVVRIDQFEIDSDQVFVGRKEVEAFHLGFDYCVAYLLAVEEYVVKGMHPLGFLYSQAAGGISLRIAVDDEDFDFTRGEGGS